MLLLKHLNGKTSFRLESHDLSSPPSLYPFIYIRFDLYCTLKNQLQKTHEFVARICHIQSAFREVGRSGAEKGVGGN